MAKVREESGRQPAEEGAREGDYGGTGGRSVEGERRGK